MTSKNVTEFDRQDIYDEKVAPLVEQIRKICSIYNMPFMFSCCVKNEKTGTVYKNDAISTGSRNIVLTDDRLERHLCVEAGFRTVPGNTEIEINFDDFGDMEELLEISEEQLKNDAK